MGHFAGFFEGASTFLTPKLTYPKKCPIICFATDIKIISRTFKIRGALIFLCPKEGDERREMRDERRETGDERREMRGK
jgi:hypothetical protein